LGISSVRNPNRNTNGRQNLTKVKSLQNVQNYPSTFPNQKLAEYREKNKTFLSSSRHFQKLVQYTFQTIDTDQSGSIDKKELYSGLLMIHLKLATYAGPAACKPVTKECVEEVFDLLDWDNSGTLDRNEFEVAMTMLTSQILMRVALQLGMTLMLVPILAQYALHVFGICVRIGKHMDRAGHVSQTANHFCSNAVEFLIPGGLKIVFLKAGEKINMLIPDSTYQALPQTIISCILGMLLVPWLLYKIDEHFNFLARHWATKNRKEKKE